MAAVGADHEQRLAARGVRKGLGAYYTPSDVVDGLLDLVLDPILAERAGRGIEAVAATRVLDPSCGTGNFLVAVARRIAGVLRGLGLDPEVADGRAVRCVRGIEIDAGTARACRENLRAIHPSGGGRSIVLGDALADDGLVPDDAFDLVVGNPPFLSQLASSTARTRADAERLRARFGSVVGPYTDPAAVFLLRSLEAARPDGGVVALIEPLAVLSARDGRGVRARALAGASLAALWVAEEPVFDADVEVCAPILVRGGGGGGRATSIVRGRSFSSGPTVASPDVADASWSPLLAALQDLPDRVLRSDGVLGDLAAATADFRDQYYGLAGAVVDEVEGVGGERVGPRLVTSGLIDPAWLRWGQRTCRFHRTAFARPRVALDLLSPPLRTWADRRLVPKVLVATQTRVLEAVVDEAGDLLPSVPVVTVTPLAGGPDHLWRIGALLTSPPVTLLAARRHLGAGRNATALRLSASDVLALPLPADRRPWGRAARSFRAASTLDGPDVDSERRARLVEAGRAMCEAFGLAGDDELLEWWTGRLPRS